MADQSLENLEMLVTVSRLLSSKLELADLLTYIMQLAARVVGAERASLFLLDEKTNELYFDVALGLEPEIQKIRLKLGEGIAGACAKDAQSVIINDAAQDTRHTKKVDSQSGFVTRSVLACPMIIKGRVIGVVQALNHMEGPFSTRDLRNFEAFASQAAIAIENARLFSSVREEKRRLQVIFTHTQEGAVLTGADGQILLYNNAATKCLPLEHAGGGNSIHSVFKDMAVSPSLREILCSDSAIVNFSAGRSEPKKLFLEGTAVKLQKHGQKEPGSIEGWIILIRDVTAKKLEETMSRNFLSLISHKLKTPLTVINGYADVLSEGAGGQQAPPAIISKAADTIAKQGKKLASLVGQLLDYVQIDELDPSKFEKAPVNLKSLLKEAADSYNSKTALCKITAAPAEAGAEAVLEIDCADSLQFTGDKQLIAAALEKIIENAVKFNDKKSKTIKITARAAGKSLSVEICDNGVGIPHEEIPRIFDKFYQVESSFTGQVEGWGLGLAFAKRVVEAHGGAIEAKSKLKEGSVFTVTLPAC